MEKEIVTTVHHHDETCESFLSPLTFEELEERLKLEDEPTSSATLAMYL